MITISSLKARRLELTKEGVGVLFYPSGEKGEGTPTIVAHETEQIKTLEQLLDVANVDKSEWEVERWRPNTWAQMSGANGLIQLWQVRAELRKKDLSPKRIDELLNILFKTTRKAIKMPIVKVKPEAVGKMFMLGVPDLHLGKLAWADETGHGNWDCKIAKQVWEDAINDLLAKAPDCEECWFPIGNDFFNVDNKFNMTTNGTPQDEDGRWQKTFDMGIEMTEWAISRCRKKFLKVKVIMVYGNHDTQRSYMLGKVLERFAKYTTGVEIDCRPLDRKYFQWGETGLGLAHGDRMKEKDISNLFQNEAREIWGNTKRCEIILGHVHNPIVKTMGGVLCRWLSALCSPDYWHAKSGYVMAEKSATGLVYNQKNMELQIMHYPNPELYK